MHEDLAAIITGTGAQNVFGAADGALFALHASLTIPAIRNVAVFEPVLFAGQPGVDEFKAVITRGERLLAHGDAAAAMAGLAKDAQDSTDPRATWVAARSQWRITPATIAVTTSLAVTPAALCTAWMRFFAQLPAQTARSGPRRPLNRVYGAPKGNTVVCPTKLSTTVDSSPAATRSISPTLDAVAPTSVRSSATKRDTNHRGVQRIQRIHLVAGN